MPEDSAHDVHRGVAGGPVAALGMDGLEDGRSRGERQGGAAIFLRDQRGEIAGFGKSLNKLGGIGAVAIEVTPVLTRETSAELRDLGADFSVRIGGQGLVHRGLPKLAPACLGGRRERRKLTVQGRLTGTRLSSARMGRETKDEGR